MEFIKTLAGIVVFLIGCKVLFELARYIGSKVKFYEHFSKALTKLKRKGKTE